MIGAKSAVLSVFFVVQVEKVCVQPVIVCDVKKMFLGYTMYINVCFSNGHDNNNSIANIFNLLF